MKRTHLPPSSAPPLPIANSYWVEPGRLLAGEYPGASSRPEAMKRLQALLDAGIDTFIDLTEPGELPAYDSLLSRDGLPREGRLPVEHRRLSIVDHGLPKSPRAMAAILDVLGERLAAGRCVYVHCRAGIGRTGMTIGCHLIRSGFDNAAALARLQELWKQCARSQMWPSVPETPAQVDFVRNWQESTAHAVRPAPSFEQRSAGALMGLAIGEALAIRQKSAGPERQGVVDILTTGADTAMTRAVAASLSERAGHDAADQMQRYSDIIRGAPGDDAGAVAVNLSPDFKRAVATWQWSRKPYAGTHDPKNLDPHSLARSLAVALHSRAEPAAAIELAVEVSSTTQQSPVVLDAVRIWTGLMVDALSGVARIQLLDLQQGSSIQLVRRRTLRKELNPLLDGHWSGFAADDGGAVAVIALALHALQESGSFEQGMRALLGSVANLDIGVVPAGAAAALYGAIAGAHFSVDAIPPFWQRALPQAQALRQLARSFGA